MAYCILIPYISFILSTLYNIMTVPCCRVREDRHGRYHPLVVPLRSRALRSAASCARETLFGGIKVLLTGLKAA